MAVLSDQNMWNTLIPSVLIWEAEVVLAEVINPRVAEKKYFIIWLSEYSFKIFHISQKLIPTLPTPKLTFHKSIKLFVNTNIIS